MCSETANNWGKNSTIRVQQTGQDEVFSLPARIRTRPDRGQAPESGDTELTDLRDMALELENPDGFDGEVRTHGRILVQACTDINHGGNPRIHGTKG